MKIALITTTINVPTVLALYRKLDCDVRFFVAGDLKTASGAQEFCEQLGNCVYLPPKEQERWKVSEHLGWDTITRRNITLLEALKWGADVIVTIDDDNIPCSPGTYFGDSYFDSFEKVFNDPHDGCEASSPQDWFDAGQLLFPTAKHRGFPIQVKPELQITSVVDARIGVAAGICMGDPDIDAVTRIERAPIVHQVSELLRAGVVTDPRKTKTVFNTQNTAFIREIAPAMFCAPALGRFDDIYASLITQRIMAERNLYVHFGQPFVWQQRNPHNLCKDLRVEIDGMENVKNVADHLFGGAFTKGSTILEMIKFSYQGLVAEKFIPQATLDAAWAWCEDVESVL